MMIILFLILSLCVCPLCLAQEGKEADQKVDGFSLVQYEDGGEKKWELNGASAEVEEGKVKIEEISAVAFGEETTFKLKAREGDFDREKNLVHLENNVVVKTTDGTALTTDSLDWNAGTRDVFTDEEVTIKKSDFQVNGKGADVDLEQKTAKLKKDVIANITSVDTGFPRTRAERGGASPEGTNESGAGRGLPGGDERERSGAGPPRRGRTTIRCDGPLDINYKKNKATFQNNVEVKDSQGNILADRIDVYFTKDMHRIRCVVARENVRIVNGENVTYSEKAIYLVDQGRVILPKRPKLVIQHEQ